MPSELLVRDLEFADLDALLALYTQLHPGDDPLPARADVERSWRAILSDPALIYLGGFSAGALLSACNAAVIANLTRGGRPYAVIENVVTDAGHRRMQLGATVLQRLIDRCWERGCYKIMLMSAAKRSEIHGFYTALGFDRDAKQAFVLSRP